MGSPLIGINDLRRPVRPRGGTGRHRHPCWQIETMLVGACELQHPGGAQRLEAGMVAVIPPEVDHAFRYDGSRVAWISVKAELPGLAGDALAIAPPGPRLAALVAALQATLDGDPAVVATLARALAIEVRSDRREPEGMPAPLAAALTALEGHDGSPLSVDDLAARAGVGANHLATLFRAHGRGTPKQAIDAARAARVRGLLADADLPLAAIAESLGFADRFAFSRFVRRTTGRPPGAWRRQPG